ncbi:MAG: GNAT family N-acetyltransferase [Christensenellales bacterium]
MFKARDQGFYLGDDPNHPLAEIDFIDLGGGELSVTHTCVAESLRGQGMAEKLLDSVADLARAQGKKLSATCSYASKALKEKAKYADLLP